MIIDDATSPPDTRLSAGGALPPSLSQKVRMAIFNFQCRLALAQFELRTGRATPANRQTLLRILRRNRNTEYGRVHGFTELLRAKGDIEANFRGAVPLSTYTDYVAHVERIARGEANVLSADPVLLLAGSGGTTDRPKCIPRTIDTQRHHTMLVVRAEQAVVNRGIGGARAADRGINLMSLYAPPDSARGAVPVMSGPNAGIRRVRHDISRFWSSPEAVYAVAHQPTALYLHALFGLSNRRALYIETPFAPQVVGWLALMERHQDALVDDLKNGTLAGHLQLSAPERRAIEAVWRPNRDRAAEVRAEFTKGFKGILGRLWPGMRYIRTVTTGSFALSLPRLRWLAGDGLVVHSGCHASTEGVIGINMKTDGTTDYALALGSAYFEFIPVAEVESSQPATVSMSELEVGGSYELVLTNCAGLYRYRLGDVVRIAGRHRDAPTFNFLYRIGTLINLVGEKASEYHTHRALIAAVAAWLGPEVMVRDYSVVADLEAGIGRYTFFVELHGSTFPSDCDAGSTLLDAALGEINPYYLSNGRAPERLAPVCLKLVRSGTFDLVNQLQRQRGGGANSGQIKVPRAITDPEYLQILAAGSLPG